MTQDTRAITDSFVVDASGEERTILVTAPRRSLADRLAGSPKSPCSWPRDNVALQYHTIGRELL